MNTPTKTALDMIRAIAPSTIRGDVDEISATVVLTDAREAVNVARVLREMGTYGTIKVREPRVGRDYWIVNAR